MGGMRTATGFPWLLLLASGLAAQSDITAVHHQLRLELGNHHVTVTMRVSGLSRQRLTIRMPAWQPGCQRMQDFGQAVGNLTAADASGKSLSVTQGKGPSWSVETAGHQEVLVRYQLPLGIGAGPRRSVAVPADGRQGPGRGPGHALYHDAYVFAGPSTWMYVQGCLDVEQKATFNLPAGWEVATAMRSTDKPKAFTAPNYHILADSPFHIGRFETLRFDAADVPYRIVLSGFSIRRKQRESLLQRTRRIVRAQLDIMGKAPFSDYTFLFARTPAGAVNGLGHRNAANIAAPGIVGSTPAYNAPLDSVVSREFFHLWNPKRLRPRALAPIDYTKPNRTRHLWFCEGVTSYYGDLCCVRAGVWNESHYWTRNLPTKINKLQSNPGRKMISVAETSRTVWDHPMVDRALRREAPDLENKGELLGLLLDVKIRDATNGRGSLDDVMRGLYKQCQDQGRGFADGDVRRWCEMVAGASFAQFFRDYIDGTKELPLTKELSKIGLVAKPVEHRPGKEKPKRHRQDRRPRRRPPTWRVDLDSQASKRALRLRADMTRRIKD